MKGGWRWAAALVVTGAMWTGCKQTTGGHDESERNNPGLDSPRDEGDGTTPTPDPVTPEPDPVTPDPGPVTPEPDPVTPGPGPVTPDPGPVTPPPPPPEEAIQFTSPPGWRFYGTQHGGPRRVYGVTADEGGNVWVAGGEDGLFLLRPGADTLQRYTLADGLRPYGFMPDGSAPPGEKYLKVISVAGGPAGTVFVGYEGRPGTGSNHCESNWDGPSPDPSRYKSGDADKVTLRADGTLEVVHYDIFSGPGVVRDELRGREKICNILRIAYDKNTNSVWFGGNHGFSRGDARYTGNNTCNGQLSCSGVMEHVHPHINALNEQGNVVLLTDAYYGVAVHPSGDVFFGGSNRSTRFRYGSNSHNYWRAQSMSEDPPYAWNRFDLWPDKVGEPNLSRPADRVDDHVSGMAVSGDDTVWVSSFTKGLARMNAEGGDVRYLDVGVPHLSTVAVDSTDGSVWTGARWLGTVFRVKDGRVRTYGCTDFGRRLCMSTVADIQVDRSHGRRILVGFKGSDENRVPGAIGIYSGN
ncbi:hypothetical protein [Archangium violaceum]|uniref:Lipoprotein n=1 Tax=Archangium violaceum Cb vi76 TaxID=1406225 RepID=A0A084SE92_9BACT|nr:hypothetical protein [Archangium violaceum]KFA86777.1 hypothetical protein Q664_52215 [Archangium violaceum Cb vi76]